MRWALLVAVLSLSGCSAIKERTGEFVTEAVVDHIAERVDQRLERRGLSIAHIKSVTDVDGDGKVNLTEIIETVKLAAREAAAARAEKWAQDKQAEWALATENLVSRDEGDSIKKDVQDFWTWLQATIAAIISAVIVYLTKQIWSAKQDGKRDVDIAKSHARLDALEKLMGFDLNQDGTIGSPPEA